MFGGFKLGFGAVPAAQPAPADAAAGVANPGTPLASKPGWYTPVMPFKPISNPNQPAGAQSAADMLAAQQQAHA